MSSYRFDSNKIPKDFFWLNEPKEFYFENGINLITKPKTDFWQGTHYGFRRDDGHLLLTRLSGDFSIKTETEFFPSSQYDQCGLFVRIDDINWIKCSIESENSNISRLGSVVTNHGFSDWATQDISSEIKTASYRIDRKGKDFEIYYSFDRTNWLQMRITHLHEAKEEHICAGIYACSPIGENFHARFKYIEII